MLQSCRESTLLSPRHRLRSESCSFWTFQYSIRQSLDLSSVTSVKKQKPLRDASSSSTKRKRASLDISLEIILPHYAKTLEQAAIDLKSNESSLFIELWRIPLNIYHVVNNAVSQSKLKNAVKEHKFSSWTDFKFKIGLSKNSISSSLTTNPVGGDISCTSRHQVLSELDQHNTTMQVVLEAANVNQSSIKEKVFSPQSNETSMQAAAYSEIDTTVFSLQQNQAYGGTPFNFPSLDQLLAPFPPRTNCGGLSSFGDFSNTDGLPLSYPSNQHNSLMLYQGENMNYSSHASNSVNILTSAPQTSEIEQTKAYGDQTQCVGPFCGGGVSKWVLDESNQHNVPMPPQTENMDRSFALNPLPPDAMLVQESLETEFPFDFQSDNPSDIMSSDVIIQDVEPAVWPVPVKATYAHTTARFELFACSKMEDLKRKVMKNLYLEDESFEFKYLNVDDDWISIGCDADLKICLDAFNSSNRTAVVMLVLSTAFDQNLLFSWDEH